MTEAEWLACVYLLPMFDVLSGKATDRKLRLFGVACCRRAAHVRPDPRADLAIDVAERFADGQATNAQRLESQRCSRPTAEDVAGHGVRGFAATFLLQKRAFTGVKFASSLAARDVAEAGGDGRRTTRGAEAARSAEWSTQARLLRDIFGNPFRLVAFNPSWLTSDVLALARGIYEERAFDRMPILADALQDAGCDNADVLSHCRDMTQSHVRGCWVVDLVLSQE